MGIIKQEVIEQMNSLPQHLIPLPGGYWALWGCVGLRGTGFPIKMVLQLGMPHCSAIADQLLETKTRLAKAQKDARRVLKEATKEFWLQPEKKKILRKALQRVNEMSLPGPIPFEFTGQEVVNTFCQAMADVEISQANFAKSFSEAIDQQSQIFHEITSDTQFQEAVIWQNYNAWHDGINKLQQSPPDTIKRNRTTRVRERIVVSYLQRYCTKNDTIGFFGPVGWAQLVSQGPSLVVNPGSGLLENRQVFFEGWCIDTLAETLVREKAIRPWIAPRCNPVIGFDDKNLYIQSSPPERLSAHELAILKVCDGQRTAREIACQLLEQPVPGFQNEEEVYTLLESLAMTGLLLWNFAIPTDLHSAQILKQLLNRIEDDNLRLSSLHILDTFEKAFSEIAQASGNAQQLAEAINNMNVTFKRITKSSFTKSPGKTYGARTLVYEECRRDIQVDIGPDILNKLGPPLSLLLDSARWLTIEAIKHFQYAVRDIYNQLVKKYNSSEVPFVDFWARFEPLLYNSDDYYSQPVIADFQTRWGQILTIPPGVKHVTFSSDELRPKVQGAFPLSSIGYSFTPYHSPDVMIASSSISAVQQGDYDLVIGELHAGRNTLDSSCFVCQHPSPADLVKATLLDRPKGRVMPIFPRSWPGGSPRVGFALTNPQDYHLAISYDACSHPGRNTLFKGNLVIKEDNDSLIICTRDGKLCFQANEFIANIVDQEISGLFKIFPSQPYTPRINFDRLVVQRERWAFTTAELSFLSSQNEAERFLAARSFQKMYGVPRFVFVKTPLEEKPFYMDFDSIALVENLSVQIRNVKEKALPEAKVIISEMLPSPSQTWLTDAQGQRYTSELRIVAVDRQEMSQEKGNGITQDN